MCPYEGGGLLNTVTNLQDSSSAIPPSQNVSYHPTQNNGTKLRRLVLRDNFISDQGFR